jgi:ABC-type ATPase involved in cell division/GNAT superfamily N-acetyltransferase
MEGLFDVPYTERSEFECRVDLPLEEREWNIGLIMGPSGSGKTTILKTLWPSEIRKEYEWAENASVLDCFSPGMSIKDITVLLHDVGFSSPPNWLRPFHVLSNGEKFRVTMARTIAEMEDFAVVDEYTSVVDRTVAKTASVCIAKSIRKRKKKIILASCHYDIVEWLQPDWIFEPVGASFQWRLLQRFPRIDLTVHRVHQKAWEIFKPHHYLTGAHINGAICFLAMWGADPVAFLSVINMPGVIKNRRRGHRLVVLPDYQGVGIAQALRNHVGSLLKANGLELISKSGLKSLTVSSLKDPNWDVTKAFRHETNKYKNKRFVAFNKTISSSRLTSSFRYIGPPYENYEVAKEMVYPS